VWHGWAAPRWVNDLEDFYPGDDYVDWVGISIFQQLYPWASQTSSFAGGSMHYVKEFLDFAGRHGKPVMIAESTPFGGVLWDGKSFGAEHSDQHVNGSVPSNIWDLWFAPVLDLIESYDIRMWSYINCDWDAQPMWHNIGFGDTRLSTLDYIMTNWREHVLKNPRFVSAPLQCGLGTESRERGGAPVFATSSRITFLSSTTEKVSELSMGRLSALVLTALLCAALMHLSKRRSRQIRQPLQDDPIRYGSIEQ
jgi:hypothetical protein